MAYKINIKYMMMKIYSVLSYKTINIKKGDKFMKHRKILKGLAAITMSLVMVFGSGVNAQAASKRNICLETKDAVTTKKIADEDVKALAKAFGYNNTSGLNVIICDNKTKARINWKKSKIPYEEVYDTTILCPKFSRDKNGNLVVEKYKKASGPYKKGDIKFAYTGGIGWWGSTESYYAGGEISFFDIRKSDKYEENSINNHMGRTTFKDYKYDSKGNIVGSAGFTKYKISDVYIVRVKYTTDGKGNFYNPSNKDYAGNNDNRKRAYTDFYFLPEGVSTKLKLTKSTSNETKTMYTKQAVNVRSAASMSGKVLGTLKSGQKVTVTGIKNNWYKVTYKGKTGYVYKTYLKTKTSSTSTSINKTMYAKQAVNVRSAASMSGKILGALKSGQKVTVTGIKNNWYKITYNGKVGYVYKTYLSTKK